MSSFGSGRRRVGKHSVHPLGDVIHVFSDGVSWSTPKYEVTPEPEVQRRLNETNAIFAEGWPQGSGELKAVPASDKANFWDAFSKLRGVVYSHFQEGYTWDGSKHRVLTILNAPNLQGLPIADKCANGDFSMLQMVAYFWDTIHGRDASYTGINDLKPVWADNLRRYAKDIRPGNAAVYVQLVAVGPVVMPRIRIVEKSWTLKDCKAWNEEAVCSSFQLLGPGDQLDEEAKRLVIQQASFPCPSMIKATEEEKSEGLSGGKIALIAAASVAAIGIGWALLRKRKATPNRRRTRRRRA